MDPFDFVEDKSPRTARKKSGGFIWNLGAIFFFISALCMAAYYALIFVNPSSGLNFLPPRNQAAAAQPASPSPEPLPSETEISNNSFATATVVFETATPAPTATIMLLPSATNFQLSEATATLPATGAPFFAVQPGNPTYLPHAGGCGAMYVAGNVTDLNGAPFKFMQIVLTGSINGVSIGRENTLSGNAPEYSESGYEIQIGSGQPVTTYNDIFLQLTNQEGQPASDVVVLDTFEDCSRNLIMVNFVQVK